MTLRVAINGFGRIGRNVLRGWISRGADTGLEIVGMNSTSDPKTSAHLLTYDSILGRLDPSVDIQTTDDTMIINGKEIKFFADRNPLNCPWKDWGVDLVIESTARIVGDVVYSNLTIAPGGQIDGKFRHKSSKGAPTTARPTANVAKPADPLILGAESKVI